MPESHRSWFVRFALGAVALGALTALGCSRGGDSQKTCYPVKGQLFVKSQPADGAMVILSPQGAKPEEWTSGYPRATVAADGSFQVETYGVKDGAPAGEYVVLVTWPAKSTKPDAEEGDGLDRLRGKYADPSSSKINVTVKAKATDLPAIRIP